MDTNDIENILNTSGFYTAPVWLFNAIQRKDNHVSIQLANSRIYKLETVRLSNLWSN
jgi:hypothetical protein